MNVLNSLEKEKKETYKSIFDLPLNDPSAEVFDSSDEDQAKDSNYSAELSTQATITGATPFEVGDIDPKKDGGSVAPKIEDKSEAVDKPEVDESDEKEEAKLKEQIEQYNKYVQEALKTEEQVQEIGAKMGAAKEEVLAAIVNEEDGFFHPSTSPLVRDRLAKERSMLVGGDENLKKILTEYNKGLSDLDDLAKKIEASRENIDKMFGDLLTACKDQKQVASLRDFVGDMKFYDNKLQILQRDKVQAKYQDMKEWLATLSVRRMAEIHKSKKIESKLAEEPMVSAIVEEKPKIDLSKPEPTVDEPAAEAIDDSKKVSFETFNPTGAPIIETKDAPEAQSFGVNDLKAPGVTEESIKNGQRIDDIKKTLNGPTLQMPTPGADTDIAKAENTKPEAEAGVEEIKDLQGEKLKVDLNKPEDGGGVEINASSDVPKEEQTIPEPPVPVSEISDANVQSGVETSASAPAQEGKTEVVASASEASEAQTQTPDAPKAEAEAPKVETPQAQPQAESTQAPADATKKKESTKGGIVGALKHFFRIGNRAEADDVAQIEKDLQEERKPKEETENKG